MAFKKNKKSKEVSVSIILPTFNINKSKDTLNSILKQEYPKKEIILINDNPNLKVDKKFKNFLNKNKIKLINNTKNLGIAKNLNKGFKIAKGEVVMIMCDDYIVPNKYWINNVVKKLYSDEKIVCVLSKIITPKKVWKNYNFLTKLFYFRHLNKYSYGGGNYKKKIFKEVGYFDFKRFKQAGEDNDMHTKIKRKGYKISRVNEDILHLHYSKGSKFSDILKKEYRYGQANGAIKRKYGILKRMGYFDFDIRLLLIIIIIFSLFFNKSLSIILTLVFFLATSIQAIKSFLRTKWLPGLFLYPFAGIIIMLVQTFGGVKGYLKGRANI